MSVFTPPSQYSWALVFYLYALSIVTGLLFLGPSVLPRTWSIPLENRLVIAHGKFLVSKSTNKSPYVFVADGGEVINLGCLPEAGEALCLSLPDLRYLAPRTTTIGYFYVRNWHLPRLSNVLMTISEGDHQLMPYDASSQRLGLWSVKQRQIDRSPLTIGTAAIFPIGTLIFAIWLTIQKRKLMKSWQVN